jgi:flagellar FliL protein
MTDTTGGAAEKASKRSRLPLLAGAVLALAGGGGGFYAVQSGLLDSHLRAAKPSDPAERKTAEPVADVAFIEVPPLLVSLGPAAQAEHLRFRASLEVPRQHESEVADMLPRVQDVLNSYLRALDAADIEAQGALFALRAQMLRRVKMVLGDARVRDLLVLEFVLD